MEIEQILERVDEVHKQNRTTEILLLVGTSILFLCGITCFIIAIVKQEFIWSTPSVVTTGLLHFPIKEIKLLRKKNIALATAPALISQLPKAQAAEEIQKLIHNLFGNDER
ncbi:hypothetical protein [Draconibacterium orientale]|uniref:hypothetical protein n=1 Tax=Draconibacterium orientale TaxID=1168034 RepID=UPI002A0A1A20|nr:hypothetical protein [Draconibacterium orientale]